MVLRKRSRQLMDEIRAQRIRKDQVGVWWLGQNGYVFKSPEGTLVAVDPYLTNSVWEEHKKPVDFTRLVPVELPPEELAVDIFACTHSHQDHADHRTIERLPIKSDAVFIGPIQVQHIYARVGIPERNRVLAFPGEEVTIQDVTIRGTFALPTDDTDLNHMGYLLRFSNGIKIYITGDTAYCDLLGAVRKQEPDIMITCINGGFKNLSHWEAAQLAGAVQPRLAIPCHYDMFADNVCPPHMFRASLTIQHPEVPYQELQHFSAFIYSKER